MTGGMLPQHVDTLEIIELCRAARQAGRRRRPRRRPRARTSTRRPISACSAKPRASSTNSSRPGKAGRAQGVFEAEKFQVDVTKTPIPRFDLLKFERLSLRRRAVLARLPVHLRVLRHHRALRPRAAHQDQRADAGRARRALPSSAIAATSTSSTTISSATRRRVQAVPARARRLAASARLSVRVHDRGLDQSGRRCRAAGADERGQFRRRLRRHREPGSGDAGRDAEEAEHAAQHRREHPQDLCRRACSSPRASSSASTPRRPSMADAMIELDRGGGDPGRAWSACSMRCRTRSSRAGSSAKAGCIRGHEMAPTIGADQCTPGSISNRCARCAKS